MKDCVSCVHEYLSPMSDTCRECGIAMLNYEEAKPKRITKGDKLRSMTDEELAEFYCNDVDACPPGSDMKCIEVLTRKDAPTIIPAESITAEEEKNDK